MAIQDEYIAFLQRNLPRLGYRWAGFRKPRGQVIKRIARRMESLGLQGVREYEVYLHSNVDEWERLDGMCRITISRFFRDRGIFNSIRDDVLPEIARLAEEEGRDSIDCLSVGCCSGEEPYTLKIIWELAVSSKLDLRITAMDSSRELLERAMEAVYAFSSIKDLPGEYRDEAFTEGEEGFKLKDRFKSGVRFMQKDIRKDVIDIMDTGSFDLVLCRNLAFTYFDKESQAGVLRKLVSILRPGGFLVIGIHETLPDIGHGLLRHTSSKCIYRKPVE